MKKRSCSVAGGVEEGACVKRERQIIAPQDRIDVLGIRISELERMRGTTVEETMRIIFEMDKLHCERVKLQSSFS